MMAACRLAVWCRIVCVMGTSLHQRGTNTYEEVYSDRGTGAREDLSVWRPKLRKGEFRVTYFAGGRGAPREDSPVVKELTGSPPALAPPAHFECVWTDGGSGGNKDGSFWKAIAPPGYVCLSDVAIHRKNSGLQPGVQKKASEIDPDFRCVHTSLVAATQLSFRQWTDGGSNARWDGACWNIAKSPGMRVSRGADDHPAHQQYWLKPGPSLHSAGTQFYEEAYSDRGTGSRKDLSVWRPKPRQGEFRITYFAGGRSVPHQESPVVKEVPGSPEPALAPPAHFECVWTDGGSGGNKDGSFWKAIAPPGYVCLSDVAIHRSNSGLRPGVQKSAWEIDPDFRCVHTSLVAGTYLTKNQWTDGGSHAKWDGACWNIAHSTGMRVSRGAGDHPAHQQYRLKACHEQGVDSCLWSE